MPDTEGFDKLTNCKPSGLLSNTVKTPDYPSDNLGRQMPGTSGSTRKERKTCPAGKGKIMACAHNFFYTNWG